MRAVAYLDPASGSILLQALLAGFAGLAVVAKLVGRRVLSAVMFWRRPASEGDYADLETVPAPVDLPASEPARDAVAR